MFKEKQNLDLKGIKTGEPINQDITYSWYTLQLDEGDDGFDDGNKWSNGRIYLRIIPDHDLHILAN